MGFLSTAMPVSTATRPPLSPYPRWEPPKGLFSWWRTFHGGFLSGNSVQHWLSTKSDLPISPPNPSNLHVLPRDLLQGGGHDLCRSGQDDPHFRGQVEASWEDVKAFDHRRRPQQRLWILLPSALQVEVAHRDITLVPLHPAG